MNDADVSEKVDIGGLRMEEAHFRGRKLQGATISLPSGYSGYVLGQGSNRNANGKRRASSSTEENPCWEVKAKFDELTHWNHDSLPSKDDILLRSFHWFSIAEALHKPVKVEDLVAVSYVMASRDGKLVCDSTMDARLEVASYKKLRDVYTHYISFIHFRPKT